MIQIDQQLAKQRIIVCESCDQLQRPAYICKRCMCLVRAKSIIKQSKCPKGKW